VLMLTDEALKHARYLHVAFEDDMSDEFKQNALILHFDTATKTYSSDGCSTKAVESINGTPQGAKNTIDWEGIFGNDVELKRAEIVKRLKELAGMGERTADARIKAELKLVRFGVYCLTNATSGKFASLQGTKENANCKVDGSLEIEVGELWDPSIQPDPLRDLDGWKEGSTQNSELPQPPEQPKPSKSKTPELELRSFIKPGEMLSAPELVQRSSLSLVAFEKAEKREVKFGLLIRSGKAPTATYSLPTPTEKPEGGDDSTSIATDG
jgi:hypothetical protein